MITCFECDFMTMIQRSTVQNSDSLVWFDISLCAKHIGRGGCIVLVQHSCAYRLGGYNISNHIGRVGTVYPSILAECWYNIPKHIGSGGFIVLVL